MLKFILKHMLKFFTLKRVEAEEIGYYIHLDVYDKSLLH